MKAGLKALLGTGQNEGALARVKKADANIK
jgi:hypothetical protein